MRPFAQAETGATSGPETITYTLPAGSTVTTRLEGDSSTTIHISIPGYPTFTWNSGIALTCFILGNGFGITAGILSRNEKVGMLTNVLISRGCAAVMKNVQERIQGEDGDG